jgi:hypothetical protein
MVWKVMCLFSKLHWDLLNYQNRHWQQRNYTYVSNFLKIMFSKCAPSLAIHCCSLTVELPTIFSRCSLGIATHHIFTVSFSVVWRGCANTFPLKYPPQQEIWSCWMTTVAITCHQIERWYDWEMALPLIWCGPSCCALILSPILKIINVGVLITVTQLLHHLNVLRVEF